MDVERRASKTPQHNITHVPALHSLDVLLHIFEHLDLKDCLSCRLVCHSWFEAIRQHFRTLPKLRIVYEDITQISDDQLVRLTRESAGRRRYTLEVYHILSYHKFAHILSLFPSVASFSLRHHPMNDIFLALLVVFLPRLHSLKLKSCWMHPSMLAERLARSCHSINPLWSILTRFYCPKYLQENDASLDYLLDTIRHRFEDNEPLSRQLCHFLRGVSQCISVQYHQIESGEVTMELCTQSQLSKLGYSLLLQNYHHLSSLTLSNCGLNESTAELVLKELKSIRELDLSDNEAVEGHCLQYLASTCTSLTAGSFNLAVSIHHLLAGILQSAAISTLHSLELTGCISANLHHLEQLNQLTVLKLHFYCDRIASNFAPFQSITRLKNLQTLVLTQEYCYEERSAVDGELLCAIVQQCRQLERLEIVGEYGWRLEVDDQALVEIARNAINLRHLVLTGNSPQITDHGISSLSRLARLETLTLTSFDAFTDVSICQLIAELRSLKHLCLRDNCQLSIKTLEACIETAYANPGRTLNVTMDEKQMSASKLLVKYATNYIRDTWIHSKLDPFVFSGGGGQAEATAATAALPISETLCSHREHRRWPTNLNVVIDENLRSYKYDAEELTLLKLLTIFLASILIIAMMVTTLAVVVFLPAAMAIYLLYEKIFAGVLLLRTES